MFSTSFISRAHRLLMESKQWRGRSGDAITSAFSLHDITFSSGTVNSDPGLLSLNSLLPLTCLCLVHFSFIRNENHPLFFLTSLIKRARQETMKDGNETRVWSGAGPRLNSDVCSACTWSASKVCRHQKPPGSPYFKILFHWKPEN